jgi:hypothetical protein
MDVLTIELSAISFPFPFDPAVLLEKVTFTSILQYGSSDSLYIASPDKAEQFSNMHLVIIKYVSVAK